MPTPMECPLVTQVGSLVLAFVTALPTATAQAHCALRDPKTSVFRGFPEADGYRAINRNVDSKHRGKIDTNLPFRVHFNEIGKHTLYVALRGERPIGIVHSRSEESRWGLVEIVWYFELDMRVKRFHFQRVRNRKGKALQKSDFAKKLVGRNFETLRALLNAKGELASSAWPIPKHAERLALTVVRSALKTIIVTRSVWQRQLAGLADLDLGIDMFHDGRSTRRIGERDRSKRIKGLRAVLVLDARGRTLGTAAQTKLRLNEKDLNLRWALAEDGRILKVVCVPEWPDEKTGARFRDLEGQIVKTGSCDPVSQAAAKVVQAVRSLAPIGKR